MVPVMVEGVAYRMVEMSPTKEEDVGGVRRDVIWGGGNTDHADTTLLLVVVVMIGQDVVVKRSNTLRLMLDLLG